LRVDLDETLLGSQSGHRHVDDLALLQRQAAHGELRRIRVDLHDQGATPDCHLAEQLRRLLCTDEVRDAPGAEREAADSLSLYRLPDPLADLRLRHRASTLRYAANRPTLRYYRVPGESILNSSQAPDGAPPRDAAPRRGTPCARPCDARDASSAHRRARSAAR